MKIVSGIIVLLEDDRVGARLHRTIEAAREWHMMGDGTLDPKVTGFIRFDNVPVDPPAKPQ